MPPHGIAKDIAEKYMMNIMVMKNEDDYDYDNDDDYNDDYDNEDNFFLFGSTSLVTTCYVQQSKSTTTL